MFDKGNLPLATNHLRQFSRMSSIARLQPWLLHQCPPLPSREAINRALVVLKVTATVGIDDHFGKVNALAFLNLLATAGVQPLSWLFCNGPVVFLSTRHPKRRLRHVFLADMSDLTQNILFWKFSRQASLSEPSGLMGRLKRATTARPIWQESVVHL